MKNNNKSNENYNDNSGSNFEDISFSDLFRILKHMKLRVAWTIVISFVSYSSMIWYLGMRIQVAKTAISLGDLFDIYIKRDEIQNCIKVSNRHGLKCERLYLLKERGPGGTDNLHLQIRKVEEETSMTYDVGAVKAKKEPAVIFHFPSATLNISKPVQAQTSQRSFNWYGHKHNFDFYEEYINTNTIRRYYSDGWILEYQVDRNQRSILSTFRWIRKGRCILKVCI